MKFLDDTAPQLMSEQTRTVMQARFLFFNFCSIPFCDTSLFVQNYDVVWKTIPEKATCFQDFNYEYDEKGILRNTIDHDKVRTKCLA